MENDCDRRGAAERAKGGEVIGFYVKSGEQVRHGRPGERVQAGDRLRFTYSSARAPFLAILSVDGAERRSVYFPASGKAQQVSPGNDRALPSAVTLDEVTGTERVLALFCDEAVELAPLLDARRPLAAPPGCAIDEFTLVKEDSTQ